MPEFHQINADLEGIKKALQEIIDKAQATCALLITQDGEHIAHAGDVGFINITALAALVGGMFSATREVAKIVGEMEFSIMIQQGKKRHIHISLTEKNLMLLVVFEGVEKTGWVKVQVERQSQTISKLVDHVTTKEQPSIFQSTKKVTSPASVPTINSQDHQQENKPVQATASQPPENQAETSEELNHFKKYASSLLDEIFGQ